jgi:hypothetical protein
VVKVFRIDGGGCRAAGGVRLSKALRLLITARDMAAALHLVEVARAGVADPRFEVFIAAQPPAAPRFLAAGLDVRTVSLPAATHADSPEARDLRQAARALVEEVRPDAIICGLSTPFDAGLDEAVLAEARVPTSLMQDFWGEQNLLLGRGADQILGIDQQASERNAARYSTPTVVVGSPRHAAYAALDIPQVRARGRQALGVRDGEQVVGFFGQALHSLAGYRRTIETFVASAGHLGPGVRFTLRPHPRETMQQRAATEQLFAGLRLPVTLDRSATVEEALATCDVVVSLFSICTFDTAYLNRFSAEPIAVPMSLLFDPEIAAYCRQHGNYMDFSHHTLGLVIPIYEAAALDVALRQALTADARRRAWQRAHEHLPNPAEAPQRVLTAVAAAHATR